MTRARHSSDKVSARHTLVVALLLRVARPIVLLAVLLSVCEARAHDLAIDQLSLSVSPRDGSAGLDVRGQIELDPELNRAKDEAPSPAAEERVLRFITQGLRIEVDERPLTARYELRELWTLGGATRGDLVALEAQIPDGARSLKVQAPSRMKALVVSIRRPAADGSWQTQSALVLGAEWTPDYSFAGESPGWRDGTADQFVDAGAPGLEAAPGAPPSPAAAPSPSPDSSAAPTWREAFRYVVLGVTHIVPYGLDHVLFVAGLVLASRRLKPLLLQLTAFTLAHSLTLALGALEVMAPPAEIVEPLIALSIAVVALENLSKRGVSKHRPLLVAAFGLLHGLGFAGVLADAPLPRSAFLLGLASFNVGVEIGQLVVVAVVLAALFPLRDPVRLRKYAVVPGSALIAAIGLYWSIERVLG